MANQDTVGQRFVQLIAHLGISKNAFAVSLGKTATVIQHLVDERNKPGFDLLDKVFTVYPNVSMEWLMKGVGPMLINNDKQPINTPPEVQPAPISEQKVTIPKPAAVPTAEKTVLAAVTEQPSPVEEQPAPVAPSAVLPTTVAPAPAAAPAPASVAAAAPPTPAPVVAAEAPAPAVADTSWQTALYTQQMAHQLALAELRNQHLQDQQRLMQQMMDLMQRQLAR